jgi:hypothetical protein
MLGLLLPSVGLGIFSTVLIVLSPIRDLSSIFSTEKETPSTNRLHEILIA